ncbi:MAG: Na+/H+ antiporter NhaA, partial [Nitrospirae bacterium]|nr:Na+/H+ antiporter NhaA [Nitrospirota bacterium]
IALFWANAPFGESYNHFWETPLSIRLGDLGITLSLREWINEGLMSIFFFIVGLEIKREVLVGELSSVKKALLPVSAAIGGIVVPAFIYFLINLGSETTAGWAIPMATDIAFALGVLYVLGQRVPAGLRVFLSAFAIADDIGAVLVIALFYTKGISIQYIFVSLLIIVVLAVASYLWIRNTLFYAVLAAILWFAIMGSGLHSTVAGIIIAMFIPARGRYNTDKFVEKVGYYMSKIKCPTEGCGHSILLNQEHLSAVQSIEVACHDVETPLQRLEHALHPWVAYGVIPLFALANAGLSLKGTGFSYVFNSPVTLGIILGLLVGKPLGITLFTFISVKTGLALLPYRVKWVHILGAGFLGGIGFTMSLFITALSFSETSMINQAKLGILMASVIAGVTGLLILYISSRRAARAG